MNRVCIIAVWVFAVLIAPNFASGQESGVPVPIQLTLCCKAMAFDRNLEARCGDTIVIGVLYQKRYRLSHDAMDELNETFATSNVATIKSLPVKMIAIDLDEKWKQNTKDHAVDVLYITPVRAIDLAEITNFAAENQLFTAATEPSYVKQGVSLGLILDQNRPKFIINLERSRAQGVDFSSQLLQLAEIVE